MCLDDYLYLDENTLKSLSICSNDVHGFVHAKAGREGFSILGTCPMSLLDQRADAGASAFYVSSLTDSWGVASIQTCSHAEPDVFQMWVGIGHTLSGALSLQSSY